MPDLAQFIFLWGISKAACRTPPEVSGGSIFGNTIKTATEVTVEV
jgi:hypothetical protein